MNWKTDKYLCKTFDRFNKKYFGNRLKGNMQLGWRPMYVKGHAGEFIPAFKKGDPQMILINPKLRDMGTQNYALSTLLHEMCHMSLFQRGKKSNGHGQSFQAEMKRLAKAGAFRTIW